MSKKFVVLTRVEVEAKDKYDALMVAKAINATVVANYSGYTDIGKINTKMVQVKEGG